MTVVNRWQQDATENNLTSPDGWPENMPRPGVNNSARENMSAIKKWHDSDEWRNPLLDKNGAETYTLSKGAAQRLDIVGVDLVSQFIAGMRIQIVGDTTETGYVVSSALFVTDTQLTVTIDGPADAAIGSPGDVTFDDGAGTITAANAVFQNVRVGDRILVTGSVFNDGYLDVDARTDTVLTVSGDYALEDETVLDAAPGFSLTHASIATRDVPANPVSLYVSGTHKVAKGAFAGFGSESDDLLRRTDVQPHVFKAERDLAPRGLPQSFSVGDENKPVRLNAARTAYELGVAIPDPTAPDNGFPLVSQGAGADPVYQNITKLEVVAQKAADEGPFDDNTERAVNELTGVTIPAGAGDGTRRVSITGSLKITWNAVAASIRIRIRSGTIGSEADPSLGDFIVRADDSSTTMYGVFAMTPVIPNGDTKITVTVDRLGGSQQYTIEGEAFSFLHLREIGPSS